MEEIFSGYFALVSVAPAVAAIFGAGVLMASMGFALWAVDMVAGFFYESEEEEDLIDTVDQVNSGEEYACPSCDYVMDSDCAIHALADGYCPKCGECV